MISPVLHEAASIIGGAEATPSLINKLSRLEGTDIPDLISLANKVTAARRNSFHTCTIVNARSGLCRENCRYCAQSAHYSTDAQTYPLLSPQEMLENAKKAVAIGNRYFGIVTGGSGFFSTDDPDFRSIIQAIKMIKRELPDINVCASLGMLSAETATALADSGICHYNHNLQVNSARYASLVADTHTVDERLSTLRLLKDRGVSLCCGAIFGLGESLEERIELAWELKELEVEVIPINILIPIDGTPLEKSRPLPVIEVAKSIALFRLIHPEITIKLAAGRETVMNDYQALLLLAGADGMLSGGYLTTRGREIEKDVTLVSEVGQFRKRGEAR